MNIEGLKLVQGIPFEEIVERLDQAGIPYDKVLPQRKGGGYLISSTITISSDLKGKVSEVLDPCDYCRKSSEYYLALYEMEDEFDRTQLDGSINFDAGRIVERTQIGFFY